MVTIEDVYTQLIDEGIRRKFKFIAEFNAAPKDPTFNKKVDVVWARPRPSPDTTKVGSLRTWELIAAFEIEGYDVSLNRIGMHKRQFDCIRADCNENFPSFVILYTRADHRNDPKWGDSDKRRAVILKSRIDGGGNDPLFVVEDGVNLAQVFATIP